MVTDAQRKATGARGEAATADYLRAQGYRVVDRNWHCKGGELDIVAIKGDIIAFVEVKTRAAGAMVSPLEAVTLRKQRKIVLAASCYLATHHYDLQPRFDVSAVTVTGSSWDIEYITSAYLAGDRY